MQEALWKSIHIVVDTMLARVAAEFDTNELQMDFAVFDLASWSEALRRAEQGHDEMEKMLEKRLRRLLRGFRLLQEGALEFVSAVRVLVDDFRARRDSDPSYAEDNRAVWARALQAGSRERATSCRAFRVLPQLIKVYLSVWDGTGQVERDLGHLTHMLSSHEGPLDEDAYTLRDLMEVHLDGPRSEEELATRSAGAGCSVAGDGALLVVVAVVVVVVVVVSCSHVELIVIAGALMLTDYTRECARLWLEKHGRRFCLYRPRRERAQRRRKAGTDASVARLRGRALDSLLLRAETAPQAGSDATILATPRKTFVRDVQEKLHKSPAWTPALQRFHKLTLQKVQDKRELEARRRRSLENPHVPGPRLRGGLFPEPAAAPAAARGADLGIVRRPLGNGIVGVVNATLKPLPATQPTGATYRVQDVQHCDDLWAAVSRADLVIVNDPTDVVDRVDALELKVAFVVVATGRHVLAAASYAGFRPHLTAAVVRHAAAATRVPARLLCTGAVAVHGRLRRVVQKCASLPGSKWTVVTSAAAAGGQEGAPTRLASLEDAASFLRRVRRLARPGGLGGKYFRRPPGE